MTDSRSIGAPTVTVGPADVELVRLDGDDPRTGNLRAAVLKHRLAPGQHRFSDLAVNTLPRADADSQRIPFAVVAEGTAVGFGIIDRRGAPAEVVADPSRTVLLRAFYIDSRWQGHGFGRGACAALDPLVREVAPEAGEVLLTVNEHNHTAIRAYLAGGFGHTGYRYLSEDTGPQFVLRRGLRT
ncbi:GNAT family N-acetyltransferase [Marinactinospora thermotolerans]|uniref:Acetyltransferase (GNAT) family protein n=1 Tax=Marinactinospora thermotolerans DSM 45154 TaxID=1122192 RepID=A0A1T4RM38_9ACTN|nr:GNAT family N-acetyltransferase [Marinactinospora thermotolerans]SKA17029.1 Acetyltransferase (GNAT) family protein [Marinactinospora thermotolerans DSM 45154]